MILSAETVEKPSTVSSNINDTGNQLSQASGSSPTDRGKSIFANANDLLTQYPSRCVVASDCHPSFNRIPNYPLLLPALEKKYSQVLVRFWTEEHPAMILSGTARNNKLGSIIAQYYRHS